MANILSTLTILGFDIEVYFILIILGISIFFIFRRVFKNRIQSMKQRRVITWVSTLIATPLIYVAIIILWIVCIESYPNRAFNRQQWLTDTDKRYEFAKDIVNSEMLMGKTKKQVQKILGVNGNAVQSDDWYYYLGFRPEIANIDPDNLEITFKGGKVISVEWHKR